MTRVFLRQAASGKMFEIVARDLDKGTITIKGEFSQFEEPFDKARLKQAGYELITQDGDPSPPASAPSTTVVEGEDVDMIDTDDGSHDDELVVDDDE